MVLDYQTDPPGPVQALQHFIDPSERREALISIGGGGASVGVVYCIIQPLFGAKAG